MAAWSYKPARTAASGLGDAIDWRDPDYEEPLPEPTPEDFADQSAWIDYERFDGPLNYEGTGGECRQWRAA